MRKIEKRNYSNDNSDEVEWYKRWRRGFNMRVEGTTPKNMKINWKCIYLDVSLVIYVEEECLRNSFHGENIKY